MSKRNPYKGRKRITITVTEEQHKQISDRAELLGMSVPNFARLMMLYSSGVDKRAVTIYKMKQRWETIDKEMRTFLD